MPLNQKGKSVIPSLMAARLICRIAASKLSEFIGRPIWTNIARSLGANLKASFKSKNTVYSRVHSVACFPLIWHAVSVRRSLRSLCCSIGMAYTGC